MEKVERIQYETDLAITGTWSGSRRSKIYEDLGWESLSGRRTCRRILRIHKIVNEKFPSYLKDKLPPNPRGLFSGIPRNHRYRYIYLDTKLSFEFIQSLKPFKNDAIAVEAGKFISMR